ncbi:MAG: DUF2007 domain-containing protein [Gallionella sp.]|nr:DUF2007 domain-containing protein [Gallionella sp.]
MKCVYEAASGLDGHMILNLLEQYRIPGRIEGELLQGGIGELQAMGFVRVMVAEEDHQQAQQIIREWEAIQPPDEPMPPAPRDSKGMQLFIAGVILGAALMYWSMRLSAA